MCCAGQTTRPQTQLLLSNWQDRIVMVAYLRTAAMLVATALVSVAAATASAQEAENATTVDLQWQSPQAAPPVDSPPNTMPALENYSPTMASSTAACDRSDSPGWVVGADYLFIQPHFSEAIAFARGSLGPGGLRVTGQDLDFEYDSSIRAFIGYRFGDSGSELRFTYWHLPGEVDVNGANPGLGNFLVDPFGNFVGVGLVIDPNSALFGNPIVGGDSIRTTASVETNIYDLDINNVWRGASDWSLQASVGVRVADINQQYNSVILDAGGNFFSGGDFAVDFTGAGPRLGVEGRKYLGDARDLSVFVNAHGALLLGNYDVRFSQTTTVPPFAAVQTTSAMRMIPVTEIELGATYSLIENFNVSAGWLFQAWFDLGTSGGQFAGFFNGADDGNIMAYDGLFVRGELAF
jgi:hypothetical protein